MSTRCQVILEKTTAYPDANGRPNPNNGVHRQAYYRHYDGYPICTGFDLVQILDRALGVLDYDKANDLSDVQYAIEQVMPLGDYERAGYRDNPVLHGDIEYLYVINFVNGVSLSVYSIDSEHDIDPILDGTTTRRRHELARWDTYDYVGRKVLGLAHVTVSRVVGA
jgi:hypothetical protein